MTDTQTAAAPAHVGADAPGFRHRVVKANGQRIHLVEAGSGPLVLLIHGGLESWYSWRHQIKPLAEAGYRVAALHNRGYGRSSKPTGDHPYRITEMVADCVGVVEALGEERAIIAGHDWGALIAWTSAWTRPDVFRAVAGVSVPFAGRGMVALPGNPFGEIRPSVMHRRIAGSDDVLFYQEFQADVDLVAQEFEEDVRRWMTGVLITASHTAPLPPEIEHALETADVATVEQLTRSGMFCLPKGTRMVDRYYFPDELPEWLSEDDLDFYVSEFEYVGCRTPLGYYRSMDLNWEQLARFEGKPIDMPSIYITGDRDMVRLWGLEAIERAGEYQPQKRDDVVIADCGHWIQQERPAEFTAALLGFLGSL